MQMVRHEAVRSNCNMFALGALPELQQDAVDDFRRVEAVTVPMCEQRKENPVFADVVECVLR
jgi:hypothetical protein